MPTYEYECQKCGHAFEKFQSMTDKPLRTCPKGKGKVKRLMGRGAGIIFKGSGFYQTDYRSENYKSKAKSESGAAKTPSSSETKPAKSETPKPASATTKTET